MKNDIHRETKCVRPPFVLDIMISNDKEPYPVDDKANKEQSVNQNTF